MPKFTKTLTVALIAAWFTGAHAEPQTVPYVDLNRYIGDWYEIASNPIPYTKGCVCTRQRLTSRPDGKIDVYNSCNDETPQGKLRTQKGEAKATDKETNSKLSVDFNLPWTGDYWIIALDQDYRWAVISDRAEFSLFVLSRGPTLEEALLKDAIFEASKQVNTSRLEKTLQEGCTYP